MPPSTKATAHSRCSCSWNRLSRRGKSASLVQPRRKIRPALKAEGPLDTRQLTQRIMTAKGLDASDTVLAQAIALRIVQTLRVRAKRRMGVGGSMRAAHGGILKVWNLNILFFAKYLA